MNIKKIFRSDIFQVIILPPIVLVVFLLGYGYLYERTDEAQLFRDWHEEIRMHMLHQ